MSISRRSFVGCAAAGFAALAAPGISAEAKLLFKSSDWQMASFQLLMKQKFEVKQLYDISAIDDGSAFEHMVNSLNGLQFGFDLPAAQIRLVGAFRGFGTMLTLNDYAWEKYRIGELYKVDDPKTGKPATRNLYYPSPAGNPPKYASDDPDNEASAFQDASIQALQARGVQLLACHLALEGHAGRIVRKLKLQQTQQEVAQDLAAHLLPGVLIVPSMVAAIAMLQSKGQFSYLRV
jgi:intracellular sulfur oxidation DsrE/DsrF family protein